MNSRKFYLLAASLVLAFISLADGLAAETGETQDRLVVRADPRSERAADEQVAPVTVLTGDLLERRRAATLGEVLDGLPGVANSDFGPGVGRPTVRGLQGSRVQVLEDGMGTSDVSREGADHAVAVDTLRAEQIEVFRGPATLLFGSGAAGGVVNVVSRRFSPDVPNQFHGDGRFSYGFNGNDRQGRLGAEIPVSADAVLRADYSLRRSDDFDINGFQQVDQTAGNRNRLRNSSIKSETASLTGLVRGDWGNIGLGVSYWETEYGIPENFDARPRDLGGQSDEFERIFADYLRFDLRSEFLQPLPGISVARVKMSYTDFDQDEKEFEFERTPAGGELDEIVLEAEFRNREFDTRLEFIHDPIGNWSGVFGLQFTDRDFSAALEDDEAFYVRPNVTRTLAAFVLEELPTSFGRLEFGARIDRVRANPDEVFITDVEGITLPDGRFRPFEEVLPTRSFTPLSLSAGALINLGDDHQARLALTRSQRAPSPEQLFAFGRHGAAGTFEIGDPNLSTETYNNLEVGFDRVTGPFRWEVTAFYNRVDDFTYLASEDDGTGSAVNVNDIGNRPGEGATIGCQAGDGGLCRLRNQLVFNEQVNAEFYGLEFSATSRVVTGRIPLDLRVSGDYVRGKLRDGGNLPRMTPMRLGLGVDTSLSTDWDVSIDYQRVFRQSNTAAAESATSGYHLLGFDLFWQPALLDGAQLFLQGRNLLNENGRRHQSFFKDEAPIIGRSVTTGVRVSIGDA
ncbi:MAG: TonB-dependent receptor [Wenzhouxiangella sp.]